MQEEFVNKYIEVTINKLTDTVKENLLLQSKSEFFAKNIEDLNKSIKELQEKHAAELEALRVQHEADLLGKQRHYEEMEEGFKRIRDQDNKLLAQANEKIEKLRAKLTLPDMTVSCKHCNMLFASVEEHNFHESRCAHHPVVYSDVHKKKKKKKDDHLTLVVEQPELNDGGSF